MMHEHEEKYMKVIYAPNEIDYTGILTIFLAGSIEMGEAEDWQTKVIDEFTDRSEVIFLNPRRKDWDSSWVQTATNPQFREQVEWEMDGLERADVILYYFDPDTKSPISLFELGLYLNTEKDIIVCCPDGFYRKGNVEIACDMNYTICFNSLDDATHILHMMMELRDV